MLLTRYLERDYYTSSPEQRQAFEVLLEKSDPEILDYILGKSVPETPEIDYVVARLSVPGN